MSTNTALSTYWPGTRKWTCQWCSEKIRWCLQQWWWKEYVIPWRIAIHINLNIFVVGRMTSTVRWSRWALWNVPWRPTRTWSWTGTGIVVTSACCRGWRHSQWKTSIGADCGLWTVKLSCHWRSMAGLEWFSLSHHPSLTHHVCTVFVHIISLYITTFQLRPNLVDLFQIKCETKCSQCGEGNN